MAAKIVLAALAALCCMQGISAAALPAAETWLDGSIGTLELQLETLVRSLDTDIVVYDEKTELSEHVERNIFSCVKAIWASWQTLKAAKGLLDEYKQAKKDLEEALTICNALEQGDDQAKCVETAKAIAQEKISDVKYKIPACGLAVATAIWNLKSCTSIV